MKKCFNPPLAAACAAALAAAGAAAQNTPGAEQENARAALFAMHARQLDVVRETGIENPENFSALLSGDAGLAWGVKIAPEFIPNQLSDFFTGTLVLAGPHNADGGVFGLYNPWWDAVLMLQTAGGTLPEKDSDRAVVPRVTRFAFISGESFRGEAVDKPGYGTVVPTGDDPFSIAVWRAQAATVKRFNEIYADASDVAFNARALGARDDKTELDRIQIRSALRLKSASLLMKNPGDIAVARRVTTLLREGTETLLKKHFASPHHAFFAETFASLPDVLRAGFESYGYVPAEEGMLFLFVNRDAPRLYATVSMPRGRVDDPEKGDVIFEWYDLDQAAELLAAWESEKQKGGAQ